MSALDASGVLSVAEYDEVVSGAPGDQEAASGARGGPGRHREDVVAVQRQLLHILPRPQVPRPHCAVLISNICVIDLYLFIQSP